MLKIRNFALFLVIVASCNSNPSSRMSIKDVHSFSQPDEAVVTHLDLDIVVDFDKQLISGKAAWKIKTSGKAGSVIFDTRDLDIEKVTAGKEEKPVPFKLGNEVKYLGRSLEVQLEPGTEYLTIYYRTSPDAAALQWLDPQQTAGKIHPFLFTQSQAILARTWIPCQDSPGIRFTYKAKVKVPAHLLAVMSAENPREKNASGVYTFAMKQPVPSYLMALSVGDIVYRPIGPRTGVYAEPVTIDRAAYEFADMEKMLLAAEKLYGEYAWDQYDLIVLPPSFPFGGMENPRLTFATPTILAGDRSLTSLVAHELAHSWSGNLVTNATWNDFWLNEGFTVYFERRIMEELYGKDYADMLAVLGYHGLLQTVDEFGKDSPDTKLKLDLKGRDPDDGVSDIAYEKGYFLLKLIESKTGRQKFDAFLKNYFAAYAFKTMNTEDFIVYLKNELLDGDESVYKELKIDEWIYQPGLPGNFPEVRSRLFEAVDKVVLDFKQGKTAAELPEKEWSSHEWLHFVKNLPADISIEKMSELDQAFNFTNTGNNEVLNAWLELSVKRSYKPADQAVEKFLVNVGRRKFLLPLYKELIKTEEGKKRAIEIYQKARPNYHSVATQTIDELLEFHP